MKKKKPPINLFQKYLGGLKPILAALTLAVFLLPNYATFASLSADRIVDLINQTRTTNGLNTLKTNPLLDEAAKLKAEKLFTDQVFAHTTSDGKEFYQFLDDVHYNYLYAGENLAYDFYTEQGIVDAFMKSQAHKANVLRREYQEIGVAVMYGTMNSKYTNIIVVLFGTPGDQLLTQGDSTNINYTGLLQNLKEKSGQITFHPLTIFILITLILSLTAFFIHRHLSARIPATARLKFKHH